MINIKLELIKYANLMIKKHLTVATGGNLSYFDRQQGIMYITPTNTPYETMVEDDIVEMNLQGKVLNPEQIKDHRPSSEWQMHAMAYEARKDIKVFFHAHAIYSMTVSTIVKALPAIDYMIAFSGSHELKVAPYARFGSQDLALNSTKILKNDHAVLLQNHGINCVAPTFMRAMAILENLELCARMYWQASLLKEPNIIPKKRFRL